MLVHCVRHSTNSTLRFAGFCNFQPKKKGMYVVDVIQDGAKFPGSPFQIQIGDAEVCSPKKVKVSGAMREGMTQQFNDVIIDVSDAGTNLTSSNMLLAFFFLSNGHATGVATLCALCGTFCL